MKYDKFLKVGPLLPGNELAFLSKGISRDEEERPFFWYIHIEQIENTNELLGVATDGRHLHLVEPLSEESVKLYGLTPGFYEVVKRGAKYLYFARIENGDNALVYPNWRRVIPTEKPVYTSKFYGFRRFKNNIELAKLFHGFPELTALSLSYLLALDVDIYWEVEWYSKDKPVKFTHNNQTAIIMPIHVEV